mgnify:CR=1 FL=1
MGLISHEGIGTCTGIQDGGAASFNSFLVRSLLWEGKILKKNPLIKFCWWFFFLFTSVISLFCHTCKAKLPPPMSMQSHFERKVLADDLDSTDISDSSCNSI